MKKNILIALLALMAVALNSNAQNNTYNMVIEMANGTKITIGPNDVKDISFNNGELVISGEDINTLNQINKLHNRIDSLGATFKAEMNMAVAKLEDEFPQKLAENHSLIEELTIGILFRNFKRLLIDYLQDDEVKNVLKAVIAGN